MKICILGLGYIGLPTAALLASLGNEVYGCDVNGSVVNSVNEGNAHFHEPDLQMILSASVQTGRLKASLSPTEAEYYLIAVPTPFNADMTADMSYVISATESICPFLSVGSTVILESTSPVGSTELVADIISRLRPDLRTPRRGEIADSPDVSVAHCPERILPGQMLKELVSNDRIIGGLTPKCSANASRLYETFVRGACHVTDSRTAELSKLTENAFRDVNIAFANELSMICDHMSVDVWRVRDLANKHPRVSILEPGAGVGGHCIAVDPWFIVSGAKDCSDLIRTARLVNDRKPKEIVKKLLNIADGSVDIKVVACFGASYKADVDDLRESPALRIIDDMSANEKLSVLVVDPHIHALPSYLLDRGVRLVTAQEALVTADMVAILVGHSSFQNLRIPTRLASRMVDAIGLFRADQT